MDDTNNDYYLHHAYIPQSLHHSLRVKGERIWIASGSRVESYQRSHCKIDYSYSHEFKSDISSLQVIPCYHNTSDYLFVVDKLGRYTIWNQQQGYQHTNNQIIQQTPQIYTQNKQKTYSGLISEMVVKNTQGWLFFTISNLIKAIKFTIKRTGMKIQTIIDKQVQYTRWKSIKLLSQNKPSLLIGIIQENQDKTWLHIHDILKNTSVSLNEQSLQWSLQKANMLDVSVTTSGDLLVTTFNDISLYQYSNKTPICCYRVVAGYGLSCCLGNKFAHFGQQLLIFNKEMAKGYGPLIIDGVNILKNTGLVECIWVGQAQAGEMVGLVTYTGEVYFLMLYENLWKLVRKIESITMVFSLSQVPSTNSIVTTNTAGLTTMQVTIVQPAQPAILISEQKHPIIEKFYCIQSGQYIILASSLCNLVYKYNDNNSKYEMNFQLPEEDILNCAGRWLVSVSALHQVNFTQGEHHILRKEDCIICCTCNQQYLCYFTINQSIKIVNIESATIETISTYSSKQYYWYLMQENNLLSASYEAPGSLTLTSLHQQISKTIPTYYHKPILQLVQLQTSQLIIIGYTDGTVDVFNLISSKVIKRFSYLGCNGMSMIVGHNTVLLNYGIKQYLLNQILDIHGVYLSSQQVLCMCYSNYSQSWLIYENSSGTLKQIGLQSAVSDQNWVSKRVICEFEDQIPSVLVHQEAIYVASVELIQKYKIRDGKLIQQQLHTLKQVTSISQINLGVLVLGIDTLDNCMVLLFGFNDLQIISSINIGNKKNPKDILSQNENEFIIKYDNIIAKYQINYNVQPIEIVSYTSNLDGNFIAVQPEASLVAISDPYKWILTYYIDDKLTPITKFIGSYMITGLSYLNSTLVCGDQHGTIQLLEYNMQAQNDANKMQMTVVGTVTTSSQILSIQSSKKKNRSHIIYASQCGYIGKIYAITPTEYKFFKEVQDKVNQQLVHCPFNLPHADCNNKIINAASLQLYLKDPKFQKHAQMYQSIIN